MDFVPYIIVGIIALALIILLVNHIHVVKQSHAYVIERLGAFKTVWGVGFHVLVPFLDRIAKKVTLKEQVLD